MARKIEFKAPININASIIRLSVDNIELSADTDGTWKINWSLEIPDITRTIPLNVSMSEQHSAGGTVSVKRAEIAVAAGVTEEQVRTNLTLAQTEGLVTQIALSKVLPIFGSNLSNVQV